MAEEDDLAAALAACRKALEPWHYATSGNGELTNLAWCECQGPPVAHHLVERLVAAVGAHLARCGQQGQRVSDDR